MKVLLTGGLGFIGKRFIENFQNSHDLIVFTTENSIKNFNPTEIPKEELKSISEKYKTD